MRKLWAAALAVALVLSLVGVAHGEDYRARALEHLRAKYGTQVNAITLHEGGLSRLELTGETFWMAKYFLGQSGSPSGSSSSGSSSPSGGGSSPASPSGKDIRPTPPDHTVSSIPPAKGTILPAPADRSISPAPEIFGLIAIRLATGAILDGPQMEAFHQAEQAAWEKLAAEAGKTEVSLYRRLRDLPAEARLSVVIQPSVKISQEIRVKLAELRAKYPMLAKGLALSDEQLLGGGGVASDLPTTAKAEPAIAIAPSPPQPRVPSEQDTAYRLQAEAFFNALGQLRLEAVRESVKAIEAALTAMGAEPSTEPGGEVVTAKLTAKEVESIASLDAVVAIYEQMTAEPAMGFRQEPAASTPLKATDAVHRQSTEANVVSSFSRETQLAGAAFVIASLFIGLFALTKRR